MAAYHHEEGFLLSGSAQAVNRTEELFGRLRVLEMFVKDNQAIYATWLSKRLESAATCLPAPEV
jgi:hypothetical protein